MCGSTPRLGATWKSFRLCRKPLSLLKKFQVACGRSRGQLVPPGCRRARPNYTPPAGLHGSTGWWDQHSKHHAVSGASALCALRQSRMWTINVRCGSLCTIHLRTYTTSYDSCQPSLSTVTIADHVRGSEARMGQGSVPLIPNKRWHSPQSSWRTG